MKKVILPVCLWVSLLLIIVVGIILSEANYAAYDNLSTYGAIQEIYADYTKAEERTTQLAEDTKTNAKVIAAYDVYNKNDLLGYVYIATAASDSHNDEKLTVLVAMDPETEKLLTFSVLSSDSNDYYNTKESDFVKFKNRLIGTKVSNKNFLEEGTYTVVSGATNTSNGIANAIKVARVQFYKDINKELPVLTLSAKLNKTTQVAEENVFNKFNAQMTVTSDTLNNATVNIVFTYDFETSTATFVSADKTLEADIKALCMSKIKAPTDYIKEYNAATDEYTIITKNTFGSVLTTVINVDEQGVVESYSVTASPSFTVDWSVADSAFDSLIGSVVGTNVANGSSLETVSNATVTSNALKLALSMLNDYLSVGGNE